ncbi:MAG: T9SS type A sorting domain-containing protein [Bacteroidales bacterium]
MYRAARARRESSGVGLFSSFPERPQRGEGDRGLLIAALAFYTDSSAFFSDPRMLGSTTHTGWHAKLTDPNKYTIKHVLTPTDSSMNFGKYITIPVDQYIPGGISVNPGEIVGINVTFVPGYNYSFGDTIFSYDAAEPTAFKNTMRYGFYGTDDANANPDLFLDPYNDLEHYNGTYLILTDGRYGTYSSGSVLNEAMYPYTDWGLDAGAFFDWQVGVENNEQTMEMSIYPNPATDQVNITIEDYNNATVEVYNLLGEVVKSAQVTDENTQLDVANLNNGTYIVRVMNGDNVATKKVVIRK